MRAILLHEHGGPEKLIDGEIDTPTPGPAEVLVRIQATALNHLDIWVREGMAHLKLTYPHILGSDIVGELAEDKTPVIVSPGLSCMHCQKCLSGRDNLCRRYHILGEHTRGGYAEYIAVPRANIIPRPQRRSDTGAALSLTDVAAFPLAMMTAWQMLKRRADVQPGETVVIIGAGSGVGSAGVQVAKLLGARVIATATSDTKLAKARGLGADETINSKETELAGAVKSLTNKRGADVIFEHVGEAVWEQCIQAIAWGGRLVTCGATTGHKVTTDLRHVFFRQISILGSTMASKGDLIATVEHLAAGRLSPVVDTVMPMSEVRAAHQRMEDRAQFGKIVLDTTA